MSRFLLSTVGSSLILWSFLAHAQDEPDQPDIPSPDVPDEPLIIDDRALDAVTKTPGGKLTNDLVANALRPSSGGLTPDKVADRAARVSPVVLARQAELRAAAHRVDQAYATYFPTVTAMASYTRLSRVENMFDIGVDIPGVDTAFPVIVNQYSLSASLEVPLSDYVLRLTQAYAAASVDVEAKELEVDAQRMQTRADAKIAYFQWVRAMGQSTVADLGSALSQRHLADARISKSAGLASDADVGRLVAQLAQSRHLSLAAKNFEKVAAEQLRTILRYKSKKRLLNGVDIFADPPKLETSLPELKREANQQRLDKKALEKTRTSLVELESVTRAQHYPRFSAFGTLLYANPNPRIFPQQQKWDLTWEIGARMTWVINDTFSTIGAAREIQAQRSAVDQQLRNLRDGIRVSVTSAYYDVQTARSAIVAAKQSEIASTIALDARRKLFRGGNATATDIVDAEAALTDARLKRVDAHVDYMVAMARLELAVGGPVK